MQLLKEINEIFFHLLVNDWYSNSDFVDKQEKFSKFEIERETRGECSSRQRIFKRLKKERDTETGTCPAFYE
jgi:hypothetical protein